MILITGLTGVTKKLDIQLQSPAKRIGVKITGAALTSNLDDAVTIAINRVSSGAQGNVQILPTTKLRTLFEIGAFQEGFYYESALEFSGSFDIGFDGAVPLGADEYFSIDIDGLDAAMTLEVNAIDTPILDNAHIKYEKLVVDSGKQPRYDVSGAYLIALYISKIKNVSVEYANGRTVPYTKEDLVMMSRDLNDIVKTTASSQTWSYENFVMLPIETAKFITITPSDDTAFANYALKEVLIQKAA